MPASVEAVCRIAADWRDDETLAQLIAARYTPIRAQVKSRRFEKKVDACAAFVVAELEYWSPSLPG